MESSLHINTKDPIWGPYWVPDSVLRGIHALPYLIFTTPCEIETFVIPILQMGKSRHREAK